jgi:3-(3-hydroxy-phenyl)propionate hydroxylase
VHHPTAEPRPSLYYPYQVFQPWLPTEQAPDAPHQVVIAGNGPAGMVTALELARHGVPSVVVTAERQFSQGSRAIVFTRRSMEILQQFGVDAKMTAMGLPWRYGNSFYRGERVFRMEAPHDENERFHPMLNLQQQYLEQFLYEACEASPLIDFRWGNKVVQVTQQEGYADVLIDTPVGEYTLPTTWLVDATGGRSAIRSALNLQMEGASYEGFFVIADIQVDLPLPTERRAYFDPDWNRGNTVLMHREPHGIWRIDYQLPPGESPEDALREDALQQRIDAQLAMIGHAGVPWKLDWSSVYSARALTLPRFRHGSILFTGDAAHLLPIFGVRGANTGFQDAQSLGWHLAYVVKGLAGEELLANYSDERVGAAREIVEEAGKSTRFMAPPSPGFRLLRDAVLSLSLKEEFVRPLYHWRTSRPHEYTHSALNCPADGNAGFTSGPRQGASAANVRLAEDDYLLDHLGGRNGGSFDLLYFSSATALPSDLQDSIAALRVQGLPLRVTVVGASGAVAGADHTLADALGRLRTRYGAGADGSAYLLRPDQHVCARWHSLTPTQLHAAIAHALPILTRKPA